MGDEKGEFIMRQSRVILLFSIILMSLFLGFQNCERGVAVRLESTSQSPNVKDVSNEDSDTPPPTDNYELPIDKVLEKCEAALQNGTLNKMTTNINFSELPNVSSDPKKTQYCKEPTPFIPSGEIHYNSYAEQRQSFELPDNAILCNVDFKFDKQLIKYDDHFLFSFDNRVLASNSKGAMKYLNYQSDMILDNQLIKNQSFDWSLLKGKEWGDEGNKDEFFYCLGEDLPGTVCQWPITETEGVIKMEYPPVMLMQIANQNKSNKHDFSLVLTGDNDPGSDCQHTPINFQIDVLYVQ